MIYGANGFSGSLLAEEAVKKGMKPILAGRSESKISNLAKKLNLEYRIFEVFERDKVYSALSDVDILFNIAGPYTETNDILINTCLKTKTHYLDLAGDIDVVNNTFSYHQQALYEGILLMSEVGYHAVATDCLAAYAASHVENCSSIELGIFDETTPSRGTFISSLDSILKGGFKFRDSKLRKVKFGKDSKKIEFIPGKRLCILSPMAEYSIIPRTTGVKNLDVYLATSPLLSFLVKYFSGLITGFYSTDAGKKLISSYADRFVKGPNYKMIRDNKSYAWAKAKNDKGEIKEAWLEAPEAYFLTAEIGVEIVRKIFESELKGALTPVQVFGQEFILKFDNVSITDNLNRSI